MSNRSEQIQAVKDRANIVEIVEHFERLKRKGRYMFCKCPLHGEHTASFAIKIAKNTFHCYGCGAGSSPADFIMQHLRLEYMQALKWIADFYGLPLDEATPRTYQPPTRRKIQNSTTTAPRIESEASLMSESIFSKSMQQYDQNNFVKFLHTQFESTIVENLIDTYNIGTSAHYPGGCVFWQVDQAGGIRAGKIMPYNPGTGKRVREPIIKDGKQLNPSDWAHSVLKIYDYNLQQVFYGLHLLSDDNKNIPVAIVESEKTAIIASVFIPSFIWLASGQKGHTKFNKHGEINTIPDGLRDKFTPLAGRKIVLFPDDQAQGDWEHLAAELSNEYDISVNNILQQVAHLLPPKSDLCDYLTSDLNRTAIINRYKAERANLPTAGEVASLKDHYISVGLRGTDFERAEAEIRRELMQVFKDIILKVPPESPGAKAILINGYSAKGLLFADMQTALDELVNENEFDNEGYLIGPKVSLAA